MENCNFIGIYDDVIPDYFIKTLMDYYKSFPEFHHKGVVSSITGGPVVDEYVKQSTDLSSYDLPGTYKDKVVGYVQSALNKYIDTYPDSNKGAGFSMRENFNFQHYEPSGGFKEWHCEVSQNPLKRFGLRHLVWMTYLNTVEDPDDEYGGGTEFYHQNVKVKAVKGRTVIWPAGWTHTHRGIVSKTQEKFILTGWYNYTNIPEDWR